MKAKYFTNGDEFHDDELRHRIEANGLFQGIVRRGLYDFWYEEKWVYQDRVWYIRQDTMMIYRVPF